MIECWVTGPAGTYLAHLDRSQASPFRRFAVSRMRGADPGVGSLEYHRDNALVTATPTLFADGHLVWMRYRGKTLTWIIEERKAVLDSSENATDWIAVSGRGVKQLLADRIVWPSEFDETQLDPSVWGLGGYSSTLDADAASGDSLIPVTSTVGAAVGIPVQITGRPVGTGAAGRAIGVIQSIDAGVSVTLEDDLAVSFRKGSRILGATQQWRRFVNRSCGEMLWDLISESNPRFATAIVRGTIEADAGWTQDLRFDNLLEVVDAVTKSYGDIEMDGLTFSYYAAPGVDRSASVIFEEGADLLKVERATSDRDTISWVVAEGVGEGSMATLRFSKDVSIARRREGYLDAKDAGNLPLVQLRADAAIDELAPVDSIAVEVTEGRFAAFVDYDLHDTVRIIAPSRGIDESAVIVAMYLQEGDDERIRVGFDVNSPRTEHLLQLEEGNRSTANSVGVRNRQPQGQLTVFNFADSVYFDSTTPSVTGIYIPDDIYVTTKCRLAIHFDSYPMPVSAAASGGGSTSGASSASSADSSGTLTSASGGASTSGGEGAHWHYAFEFAGDAPIGSRTAHNYSTYGSAAGVNLETGASGHDILTGAPAADHTHSVAGHVHTVAGHDHGIAHTHSTPNHVHSLTPASTKEAYPASHSVILKVYNWDDDAAWDLVATISGITEDVVDEDLILYIAGPGQWEVRLQSAGGQPNGGRIGAHLMGFLVGAFQTA